MITIVRNGVLATLVMVLFFDLTNFLFRHGLDFSYINGTSTGLDPESFFTRLIGYVIVFGGGIFLLGYMKK